MAGNAVCVFRSLFQKYVLSKLGSADEQKCVLFPLCGKTLDMKAVLDAGHRVIGVEGCQKGVEAFFQENNISYTIDNDASNQCHVYKVNVRQLTWPSTVVRSPRVTIIL